MNKTALNSQKEKHSMLSLRRATFVGLAAHRLRNISIHALLAESDMVKRCQASDISVISIHALLAESDISQLQCILGGKYFYPRSPCGERLQSECPFAEAVPDFYPRSPCGERLVNLGNIATTRTLFLSTLSLRRATVWVLLYATGQIFLSTLSLRRATESIETLRTVKVISIHALLAESDSDR